MTSSDDRPEGLERLRHVAPFDSLPHASLLEAWAAAERYASAAGTLVLAEDTDPAGSPVFVILSGGVRLVETEQRSTVRHLRAGQVFGHFALLRGLPPPYRAEISRPGELLGIAADTMLALFDRHPFFAGWFQADLRRFERELGAFDDVAGSRFLFGQRLGELARRAVPECEATLSIGEVARTMSARDSDCAIVTADGRPVGLVTDADLRDRVVAAGLPYTYPVRDIVDDDLPRVSARACVFDGMLAMEGRGGRHLLLLDDASDPVGVLGDTDLARTLLSSPAALRRRLRQASAAGELGELRAAADRMVVTLYRRGVRAEDLLKINTRFNDALTVRVLEIVIASLPAPPSNLRWSWLSLGSEGRGEMGLRTDQDNAIVHACEGDARAAAERWLRALAGAANDLLGAAGIALCEGGIMARETPMRRTLAGWRTSVREWMSDADDVRLLRVAALIDGRSVYGDGTLCVELRGILLEALRERPGFLRVLARETLVPDLPFRKFPGLRLKGASGGDRGPYLHLKRQGTHLITHAARLLCLEAGLLEQVGTLERLAALGANDPRLKSTAHEAAIAYGVLVDLRMSWEVEQVDRGEVPSDEMPLARIGETRQRLLIGAYQTVEEIRFRIRARFGMER